VLEIPFQASGDFVITTISSVPGARRYRWRTLFSLCEAWNAKPSTLSIVGSRTVARGVRCGRANCAPHKAEEAIKHALYLQRSRYRGADG
jgi:hypothetical protein